MTTLVGERDRLTDDPEDTTSFVDQGRIEGIREVSGRREDDLSGRLDDCSRGRQVRYCKASAGPGFRRVRDCVGFRGDAFRVVYAVQLANEIWVVHAFQKKSTQGIKTPQHEVDLIKDRLRKLKEMLR
jgi:phage-related protein